MKRFLFATPPWAGHVNPAISVARELRGRGHEVAWAVHERRVRMLLPEDEHILALDDDALDVAWKASEGRTRAARGFGGVQVLWDELLVPLARVMRLGVVAAIDGYRPDVVVVDRQAIGGAIAARERRARWATFVAGAVRPTRTHDVDDRVSRADQAVDDWIETRLARLQEEARVPVMPHADLSPELVVLFSTQAFAGAGPLPPHYQFVGPSISERPDRTPFPWGELQETRPRVLVSLGSREGSREDSSLGASSFFTRIAEALGGEPIQVILVASPELLPDPPPNFIVRARVPQLALLPRMNAVVSHGGNNTVCESLAHGLPLVVTPIRDDQPLNAESVVRAGVGLHLPFESPPASLRAATRRVLDEPSFREAAARVRDELARAGGAAAAARHLEKMSNTHTPK